MTNVKLPREVLLKSFIIACMCCYNLHCHAQRGSYLVDTHFDVDFVSGIYCDCFDVEITLWGEVLYFYVYNEPTDCSTFNYLSAS